MTIKLVTPPIKSQNYLEFWGINGPIECEPFTVTGWKLPIGEVMKILEIDNYVVYKAWAYRHDHDTGIFHIHYSDFELLNSPT